MICTALDASFNKDSASSPRERSQANHKLRGSKAEAPQLCGLLKCYGNTPSSKGGLVNWILANSMLNFVKGGGAPQIKQKDVRKAASVSLTEGPE